MLGGPNYEVRYPSGDRVACVTTVYQTRIISGSPAPADGELSAVTWFSPAELRSFSLSGSPALCSRPRAGSDSPGSPLTQDAVTSLEHGPTANAGIRGRSHGCGGHAGTADPAGTETGPARCRALFVWRSRQPC
jgi:hypothetical protein